MTIKKPTAAAKPQPKPKRPPGLAHGRWLGDFPNLSAAEKALVAACARGVTWMPRGWDGNRPEGTTTANTIRAALIRFLLLGGDAEHPVHEVGVMLRGAWIDDMLNLHQVQARVRLAMQRCHFAETPRFIKASFPDLTLTGCFCPGLRGNRLTITGDLSLGVGFRAAGEVVLVGAQISGNLVCKGGRFENAKAGVEGDEKGHALSADGANIKGDVLLNNGFHAAGQVRLLGAQIGGDLDCSGGRFENAKADVEGDEKAYSLCADGANIKGNVFLNGGFHAAGQVRLLGTQIGGGLNCSGGRFENAGGAALIADRMSVKGSARLNDGFHATGEVRLLGAQIGGDLDCSGGKFENAGGAALIADGARVKGVLFLSAANVQGAINLTDSHVATLMDGRTLSCWQGGRHFLDGFRYDRIIGFTDAVQRVEWLERQQNSQLTTDFKPQPWEQLIKVLREMGHPHAAGEVAIAKQKQMRLAKDPTDGPLTKGRMRRGLHWLYGLLAGYGHRPMRTVAAMVGVWLLFSLCFDLGREFGYFGPSNPLIHASAALESCGGPGETLPNGSAKPFWHTAGYPTPAEYTTMQPQLYSLDLILPLVDLQQDSDWAPIVINENGDQLFWGYVLRTLMWFEILFGWAMSLMLVAVLGRLVDKD